MRRREALEKKNIFRKKREKNKEQKGSLSLKVYFLEKKKGDLCIQEAFEPKSISEGLVKSFQT